MDEDGEKSVCVKRLDDRIEEVDRLSNLPDCLLHHILLNLPTKNVVKTSALSKRWENLWRYVPGLELNCEYFSGSNAFVSFTDRFLGFNSEFCLEYFKLKSDYYVDNDHIIRWIDIVVKRKVQHLRVWENNWLEREIPSIVYTCKSLVSLDLCNVVLPDPEFVSLPSLKKIFLNAANFANDVAFERLISACLVLESLTLLGYYFKNNLHVCSQSLLDFRLTRWHSEVDGRIMKDRVVAIDAPRLECLTLHDHFITSVVIKNTGSLVKVNISIPFNLPYKKRFFDPNDDVPTRNMVRNFLIGISSVKVMSIGWPTLKVIYRNSKHGQLPVFRNLSRLSVYCKSYKWEVLPIFLESCPNLKSLSMESVANLGSVANLAKSFSGLAKYTHFIPGSRRSLTSLEYVTIEEPIDDKKTERELVSYILENSNVLKKFTICLDSCKKEKASIIEKELLNIPRSSTSCEMVFRYI